MVEGIEKLITHFLRSYDKPFSARDFSDLLSSFGEDVCMDEIVDFLDSDERVFPLEKNLYITKAGAFTGMFFSFEPTAQELEQKLFVAGDRCLPFIDAEMHSCSLHFEYNGKNLSRALFETDCNTARNMFTFFGDEYASQYIAADPVNADLGIAGNNFELPPKLMLSAFSLKKIIDDTGFTKGDRLLCQVLDWSKGVIRVFPVLNHNKNPFVKNSETEDRLRWCRLLEDKLLKSFEKMGPCQTMEQQLSYVFYENRFELCSPDCGSIHEFLENAEKVGMELYGVETRIWKKGESVPVVGAWNRDQCSSITAGMADMVSGVGLPDFLLDCLIEDQLYEKKEDLSLILNKIFPRAVALDADREKFFQLQIMNRSAILRKHYNWFADFAIGPLRHQALELYSKVEDLVYEIEAVSDQLEMFPQQELAILAQLFVHTRRILELFASNEDCGDEENTALRMSLEGMEYNFDEIKGQLKSAIDRSQAGKFKVI